MREEESGFSLCGLDSFVSLSLSDRRQRRAAAEGGGRRRDVSEGDRGEEEKRRRTRRCVCECVTGHYRHTWRRVTPLCDGVSPSLRDSIVGGSELVVDPRGDSLISFYSVLRKCFKASCIVVNTRSSQCE